MTSLKNNIRGVDRGERVALVTSECQMAIVDPSIAMFKGLAEAVQERDMLGHISDLAKACRKVDIPVIHCVVKLLPEGRAFHRPSPLHAIMKRNPLLQQQAPESGLHPDLEVHENDIISERMHGVTAFHGTELEMILRGLDVQTIILAGVSTNIALIGTSIEAINRGFSVVIPEDCTAGGTPETHRHSIENTLPVLGTITDSMHLIEHIETRGS